MAFPIPRFVGRLLARLSPTARASASEQTLVTGAQLVAGVGNLAFTIATARILEPAGFAHLAAFLALYLLVHLPTGSLSAAGALDPARARRLRRPVSLAGLAAGLALAAAAPWLSDVLAIPAAFLVVLATTIPGAVLLSLERGPLHPLGMHRRIGASLVVEPVVRLGAGIPLALAAGAPGAALAVAAGGYASYAVSAFRTPADPRRGTLDEQHGSSLPAGRIGWTMASFVILAVVLQQDVLLANALLPASEAGIFAAVSTLGGITAFATVRIPTVLIPRAAHRSREALAVASVSTTLIAIGAIVVTALAPSAIVAGVFGESYLPAAPLVTRYLAAMGLFSLGRVWVTYACASGRGRFGTAVAAGTGVLHLALILVLGTDAAGVANATLIAGTALAGGMAVGEGARRVASLRPVASLRRSRPVGWVVAGLTAAGLAVRASMGRGLWVDEAISVSQARLPFRTMLDTLAAADVHPPLHAAVLWVTTRLFGFGEPAVRLPSLIAGTLMIPVLYACGRDAYNRRTGLVAASLATVAPFLVWYSQEARMYALFMLFAITAVWAHVRIRSGHTAPGDWALWAASSALLVWTHYFGGLQVLVQAAYLAWELRPGTGHGPSMRRRAVTAALALILLVAPLAPFALGQQAANEARFAPDDLPAQAGVAVSAASDLGVYTVIANLVWALVGYHADETMAQIGALWPLGMLVALALLGRGRSRETTLLLLAAAIPAAALYVAGTQSRFLFEVRYFAGAVPILMLLAARAITVFARTPRALLGATTLAFAVLTVGLADEQLNSENPRVYDFEGALEVVVEEMGPDDVLVYEPRYLDSVVSYYAPTVASQPLTGGLPGDAEKVFLVASFLDVPEHADRTGQALAALDDSRAEIDEIRLGQVRVWVFE